MLDKWEPWSVRRLALWRPQVDAAVLIGHPFSPLVYAARRLAAAGIPYVVDVGDPWALTDPFPENAGLALRRARRGERMLWTRAAGGVLTTRGQAEQLEELFPELQMLVRPNGYEPLAEFPPGHGSANRSDLRIVHFGTLSRDRLSLRFFLERLQESRIWDRIVLGQFGDDFAGLLDGLPCGVEVERHTSYPWEEAVRRSLDYDLALVIGNMNPAQLPSKAVQYLTLPIPRLAVTADPGTDALGSYVSALPGWLAISPDDERAPQAIAEHVSHAWSADDLRPPSTEAWSSVAQTIVRFVEEAVRS